jgi:hypothetical protein
MEPIQCAQVKTLRRTRVPAFYDTDYANTEFERVRALDQVDEGRRWIV